MLGRGAAPQSSRDPEGRGPVSGASPFAETREQPGELHTGISEAWSATFTCHFHISLVIMSHRTRNDSNAKWSLLCAPTFLRQQVQLQKIMLSKYSKKVTKMLEERISSYP